MIHRLILNLDFFNLLELSGYIIQSVTVTVSPCQAFVRTSDSVESQAIIPWGCFTLLKAFLFDLF
jgi:hypothetical protein